MLRKHYGHGLIGLNYISLVYGILSLKKKKTTLIINDPKLVLENKWLNNIGHLERSLLIALGERYHIDSLVNIDNYLIDQNTILYINEKLIEFSNSPYINIKEIARKIPDCFSDLYQNKLIDIEQEEFDQSFFDSLEKLCLNITDKKLAFDLDQLWEEDTEFAFKDIKDSFLSYLNRDELLTKQLHYVLQVMFQTVFSSGKNELESKYLLLSMISPRYEVDTKLLIEDLMFEFRKMGGDIIQTTVNDWGIADGQLKYLLLNSIDGMVQVDSSSYFGKTSEVLPFESENLGTQFLSIDLECYIEHEFVELFKNKRICFSGEKRMGSDFPYWEIYINDEGQLKAIYSFADYLGTKASFYYHHALEDIYNSLQNITPGLVKADWISRAKLSKGSDVWFEYPPKLKSILLPTNGHSFAPLVHKVDSVPVNGIEQCGPKRSKSLGLYSYLLDIMT